MDEEEMQNKEQEMAENIQAVKDGARLAKNISTGNALGVAKDALNLAKNKKVRRKIIRGIIIKIAIPVIVIILLGLAVFSVFNSTGDKLEEILDSVVDFFTVDYEGLDAGTITIEDKEIETIINSIDEMGISVDGLKLMGDVDYSDPNIRAQYEEALKEYVRKFYEAQAMTQTINTKPNWFMENIINGGKPYGTVYLHRGDGEEEPQTTDRNQMKYIPYDQMKSRADSGDTSLVTDKVYSIDEDGDLIYAGWHTKTTVVTKDGREISRIPEKQVILHKDLDFKRVLEQYTTPMNFFFYLAMTAENPEFVEAVIDLVKRSEIRLMIYDTEKELITTETVTYTEIAYIEVEVTDQNTGATTTEVQEISHDVTEVTTITENSLTPNLKVKFAETWFSEQEIKYKKVVNSNSTDPMPSDGGAKHPAPGVTVANENATTTFSSRVEEYKETLRGDVIDKLGERGDPGIKDLNGNNQVDENEKVDEETTFLGLMDDRFIIPNTTRPSAAGSNLISGAEIFFHLLQKDSSTQYIEQVMRYAFYKYTQRSYGVEDLDFNLFNAKDFETLGSGTYGNTIEEKLWFALQEAGFSEYAAAGVISNLWAKSGLRSNHLEDSSERYVGMSDEQYTDAINNGTYTVDRFISDHRANNRGAGYGIAEWTSTSSKEGLYYFAQSRGVSIDDEDMQIEYLIGELTENGGADGFAQYTLGNYKGYTVDNWKNATSAEDAAKAFYYISEKPAKDESAIRIARANEYHKEYKGKSHAICEQSDDEIVKCYYTSTTGRKFTVLNQTKIKSPISWGSKCNRAAAAIIASAYSNESPSTLVQSMNISYSEEGDPIIPTKFFEQYGLERTEFLKGGFSTDKYIPILREQLQNGGYAAIWLDGVRTAGKERSKWASGDYHWVAVIDYKNEGGVEEILVADWKGADWYDIDEWYNGVSFISLISEKKAKI